MPSTDLQDRYCILAVVPVRRGSFILKTRAGTEPREVSTAQDRCPPVHRLVGLAQVIAGVPMVVRQKDGLGSSLLGTMLRWVKVLDNDKHICIILLPYIINIQEDSL